MTIAAAFEWLGFAGVCIGAWAYGRSRLAGGLWSFGGCAFLAGWAILQSPIPWGVLAVQAVAGAIAARNAAIGRTKP